MIVRLIIWGVVGFLIYTVAQAIMQALRKTSVPPPEKTRAGEDMVRDPECGTYVPRNDAVRSVVKGEPQHFCSDTCRDQYIAKH